MSSYAKIAKKNYDNGSWSEDILRNLVGKGRITADEFREITGQEY